MSFPDPDLLPYVFKTAPPLDPAWLEFEEELKRRGPKRVFKSVVERQPVAAQDCRDLYARMTAPGARDYDLSQGVEKKEFTIPSSLDGFQIPVLQLELAENREKQPEVIIVYFHGGGLCAGEADSDELSCRRIIKSGLGHVRLYSIGYRLMPQYPASTCLSDAIDGFKAFSNPAIKTIVMGSSSGGQLAAAVSQAVPRDSINGVVLRCPVTADRPNGEAYIPERLLPYHTSASPSFVTTLLGILQRQVPRDGLEKLPLEATKEELQGLPMTWIQLASNDTIYSDGLCYAMILKEAGVEVQVQNEIGWPHTYWLKAPELPQSLAADEKMIEGLKWVLGRT